MTKPALAGLDRSRLDDSQPMDASGQALQAEPGANQETPEHHDGRRERSWGCLELMSALERVISEALLGRWGDTHLMPNRDAQAPKSVSHAPPRIERKRLIYRSSLRWS
jgi:hypothetical protein